MKLKALKNCWTEDTKKGRMIERKIGEEFDLDHTERAAAEQIHVLLYSKKVTITDPGIIPVSGKYRVLRSFNYETAEGFPRMAEPKAEITLAQEKACELMLSDCVAPADGNGWTPRKLLELTVKASAIKRMFDVAGEPPQNWTRDYGHLKRGNK